MSLNTTFMDCNHYCMSKIQQSKPKKKEKNYSIYRKEKFQSNEVFQRISHIRIIARAMKLTR